MQKKSETVFNKLSAEYYNPDKSDKIFNAKAETSRAQTLLKEKFKMTGRTTNDVSTTGGVYRTKINKLDSNGEK